MVVVLVLVLAVLLVEAVVGAVVGAGAGAVVVVGAASICFFVTVGGEEGAVGAVVVVLFVFVVVGGAGAGAGVGAGAVPSVNLAMSLFKDFVLLIDSCGFFFVFNYRNTAFKCLNIKFVSFIEFCDF